MYWCGPPSRDYRNFNLPMGRSPGFASTSTGYIALLRLAFASPALLRRLNSPVNVTRRLIMQKARRHHPRRWLRPLVGAWFQVLFTPLLGVLFTFPSRYWFTIGLSGVFSLTRWCWQIQTGFLRPRPTQDTKLKSHLACTGLSPSLVDLSKSLPLQ